MDRAVRLAALAISLVVLSPVVTAQDPSDCTEEPCGPDCDTDPQACQERPAMTDRPSRPDRADHPGLGGPGGHITFDRVGPAAIANYSADGVLMLDGFRYIGETEKNHVRGNGVVRHITFGDDRIVMHDNPAGLIGFKAGRDGHGSVVVDLPDGAPMKETERGIVVRLDGAIGILIAEGAHRLAEDRFEITGFMSYHLRPDPEKESLPPQASDRAKAVAKVTDAVADRRVAAEVDVRGRNDVHVSTYDDVNVSVTGAGLGATRDDPLRIEIDGELPEGRTFVANIPAELLVGPEVEVRAFLVRDGLETEVVLHRADDLEDILDPTDDGGALEYWVVRDANGVQVLTTAPHFSTQAFTVASFGAIVEQPSLIAGIAAGIVGSIVAVTVMFRPRRG